MLLHYIELSQSLDSIGIFSFWHKGEPIFYNLDDYLSSFLSQILYTETQCVVCFLFAQTNSTWSCYSSTHHVSHVHTYTSSDFSSQSNQSALPLPTTLLAFWLFNAQTGNFCWAFKRGKLQNGQHKRKLFTFLRSTEQQKRFTLTSMVRQQREPQVPVRSFLPNNSDPQAFLSR